MILNILQNLIKLFGKLSNGKLLVGRLLVGKSLIGKLQFGKFQSGDFTAKSVIIPSLRETTIRALRLDLVTEIVAPEGRLNSRKYHAPRARINQEEYASHFSGDLAVVYF